MLMNIARKAALAGLTSLLILFLFILALSVGVMRLVGQPEDIKGLINRSGVFENVVPNLLDEAEKNTKNDDGLSLKNPAIKSAAEKVFTPDYLHVTVNQTIDDIYLWLDGKADQPLINLNLTAKKAAFASEVAASVLQRAKTLPKCTITNTPTSFDPLTAKCLPAGVSASQAAADAKREILSQEGFLKDPVITAGDIKNEDGQPLFDQWKEAPKAYQKARQAPFILSVLVLLVSAAIFFLSQPRLKGLRRVGATLIVMGVLMMVFAWGVDYGVNQKLLPQISVDNGAVEDSFKTVIKDVANQVDNNYWIFGSVYLALGALAIATTVYLRRRRGDGPHHHDVNPPPPHEDKPPTHPTKPKVIKVQ
ncbi:MAG: hypothetical protein WD887_01435 [Candidatus Saccharimonadales bacterium]